MKTDYTADAIKWLNKAVYKPSKEEVRREDRKVLWSPVVCDNQTMAADGVRLHLVNEVLPVESTEDFSKFMPVIKAARSGNITGEISKYHLMAVAKVLGVYARESKNILKLSLNGQLEASAKSAEFGDGTASIIDGDEWTEKFVWPKSSADLRRIEKNLTTTQRYNNAFIYNRAVFTHSGDDINFGIDYKLLLDALSGMPDVFQYRMTDRNSPVIFSGEVGGILREAIVMPMNIKD